MTSNFAKPKKKKTDINTKTGPSKSKKLKGKGETMERSSFHACIAYLHSLTNPVFPFFEDNFKVIEITHMTTIATCPTPYSPFTINTLPNTPSIYIPQTN